MYESMNFLLIKEDEAMGCEDMEKPSCKKLMDSYTDTFSVMDSYTDTFSADTFSDTFSTFSRASGPFLRAGLVRSEGGGQLRAEILQTDAVRRMGRKNAGGRVVAGALFSGTRPNAQGRTRIVTRLGHI